MKQTDEKIIMYDSPEAAKLVTVSVYEVYRPNGVIYVSDEKTARYNNCTHKICQCGKIMPKYNLKCANCSHTYKEERYKSLKFKEWDLKEPVVTWDGDDYFFSEENLIDYMDENNMDEIDLLICEPIYYKQIDTEHVCDDAHEDWQPEKELLQAIESLNQVIETLKPHSWQPGKVRTSYKLNK
jgi:hypothetical protein